jgi:phosphoribosylanthranilate isomerase
VISGQRSRFRVKICGLTNQRDAEESIALGADALGFNTWPGSKRYLDVAQARHWIRRLPPFVSKVALLVNASLDDARRIADIPGIDMLQLHGDEDAAYCAQLAEHEIPFIKALRIRAPEDVVNLDQFSTDHILVDAHVEGLFGGTGVRVDLSLAALIQERYPQFALLLAGGLRPDNVADAIRQVRPSAVDVSSGVESVPGVKDRGKVQEFINAVHSVA